jgi:hypothetical protein
MTKIVIFLMLVQPIYGTRKCYNNLSFKYPRKLSEICCLGHAVIKHYKFGIAITDRQKNIYYMFSLNFIVLDILLRNVIHKVFTNSSYFIAIIIDLIQTVCRNKFNLII